MEGSVEGADSKNLIVQASDNGRWYTLDTITTDKNGRFEYSHAPAGYPDIYRVNLDDKSIYFPIDSIETVTVTANAADLMMTVENRIAETVVRLGTEKALSDSLLKRDLSGLILSDPASIMAYYIINKQINGRHIFNPADQFDNRVFGAVANAYNEFRPADHRTRYLKEVFLRNRQLPAGLPTDTLKVTELPFFNISLMDNTGATHELNDIVARNKVVVLSFTAYGAEGSPAYNVALADRHRKPPTATNSIGNNRPRICPGSQSTIRLRQAAPY